MAYLKRQATEAKSKGTKESYPSNGGLTSFPPRKPGFRKELKNEKGSCVNLLPVAGWARPDRPISQRQAQENRLGPMLVVRDQRKSNQRTPLQACKRWKSEINVLWATIGKKLGWKRPRNKKISELFREEEATGAIPFSEGCRKKALRLLIFFFFFAYSYSHSALCRLWQRAC